MTPAPMNLHRIARVLRDADLLIELRGPGDVAVTGAAQDSRTIGPGQLFLAWVGSSVDAHDFLPRVADAGAAGAVVERPVPEVDLPQLVVRDGRADAARIAQLLAGSPAGELELIAVTGTNGKTTTVALARHLLSAVAPTASVGTLGVVDPDGTPRPGTVGLTTPGPVEFAGWLAELRRGGPHRASGLRRCSRPRGCRRERSVGHRSAG